MSQDELHNILGELVKSSPLGTRKLNNLKQLERERQELVTALENSQREFHAYENSKQVLSQLLSEHNFDGEMQRLGYPAKVLKGQINLDNDQQRFALDELTVTLSVKNDFPESLGKIIQALKLFYKNYFKDGQPCKEVDDQAKADLENFDQHPEKGQLDDFKTFLAYQEVLSKAEEENDFSGIDKLADSDFKLALFSEWMDKSQNSSFIQHLIELGNWDISHVKLFERCYSQAESSDFAQICIDKIIALGQEPSSVFINDQFENDRHTDIIRNYLSSLPPQKLEHRQKEALEQNLQHLLSALINLKGLDQKYFYQMLGKKGLRTGVFRHLVDSMFFQNKAQGIYGMDHNYAKQVLNEQSATPGNIIATLQKAMSRGLEGTQIEDFFTFLNSVNLKLKDHLEVKAKLDILSLKDKTYSQNLMQISDYQTIRFLLFSYIYDRINTSNTNFKSLGLSPARLSELIENQHNFELEWGKNRNILSYIQNIWKSSPELKQEEARISS